jgi:hypothetical protein
MVYKVFSHFKREADAIVSPPLYLRRWPSFLSVTSIHRFSREEIITYRVYASVIHRSIYG